MSDFPTWDRATLETFAAAAHAELITQHEQIQTLKQDLRLALDAWHALIKETAE